jgi:hypothetical protein
MNDLFAFLLPDQEQHELPKRPCGSCGGTRYYRKEWGQHQAAICVKCGDKYKDWIPRAEFGLSVGRPRRDNISDETRCEVLQRYGRRCAWCGGNQTPLVIGHIVPHATLLELGFDGLDPDHEANLAPSCEPCNGGAHLTRDVDLSMLIASAVLLQMQRTGQNVDATKARDHDAGSVRAPICPNGVESVPLPGEREAPFD